METKKYKKPEVAIVKIPDFIMGDGNIGIASKPGGGPGEVGSAKENSTFNVIGKDGKSSLWDDDSEE